MYVNAVLHGCVDWADTTWKIYSAGEAWRANDETRLREEEYKEIIQDFQWCTEMKRKINEFDKVKIIHSGVTGTVVDIFQIKGELIFIIEEDKMTLNKQGEMDFKFYQCKGDELEVV